MNVASLPKYWHELCSRHGIDEKHIHDFWDEIENAYTAKARHYHTLHHVAYLLGLLENAGDLEMKDELAFAIFYHDIVYYVLHSNNEKKSADKARRRLRRFDFEPDALERIQRAIRSTKGHQKQPEEEINLFLDYDICILGAEKARYHRYREKVRYEYAVIPDAIFKHGRKKVLQFFLKKDEIFHTESSREKWEEKARENLTMELELLSA